MPEMLEAEAYRRAAESCVGRRVRAVHAPDPWFLKRGTDAVALAAALEGGRVDGATRHGKVVLLHVGGAVVSLRFGMTGRLLVDGRGPIDALEYGPARSDPRWVRFGLEFVGRGSVRRSLELEDPRRLGGVELDPDLSDLGPDALHGRLGPARLAPILRSEAPLKAVLLDQHRIAGLGNLLVDEILWRAGLSPRRPARSLDDDEVRVLAGAIRRTVLLLGRRGGSHTGDLMVARVRGGCCPTDGTELRRETVGGRTTYWCPLHQR